MIDAILAVTIALLLALLLAVLLSIRYELRRLRTAAEQRHALGLARLRGELAAARVEAEERDQRELIRRGREARERLAAAAEERSDAQARIDVGRVVDAQGALAAREQRGPGRDPRG